jgi:hypothetical protein
MAMDDVIRSQIVGTIQDTLAPLTNTVAGSTATAFSINSGAVSGGGGGVIPLVLGNPGLYSGTGRAFQIKASGFVTAGSSVTTLTLKLYQVPASVLATAGYYFGMAGVSPLSNQTFTNWNLLATTSARTVTSLTASWSFQAVLQLSATGRLEGQFTDTIAGIVDAFAATTIVTGLTGGEADMNFVMVSTLSTSQAANLNTMNEFSLYPW